MAAKKAEPAAAQPTQDSAQRKPWKKKTPVEVVLDQIDKIREDVAAKEDALKQARRQLTKLEEVRKVLESN
jgi:phage terminase large subunit GpA-like protein